MVELLKKLCAQVSVSGAEGKVRAVIEEEIAPFVDEVYTDTLGNLIAHRRGADGAKKLMMAAHMDQIGYIVTVIEESGLVRFAPIGGTNIVADAFSPVVFENGVRGVLVSESGVEKKDLEWGKCFVDIGAKNRAAAERRVHVGDYFVIGGGVQKLSAKRVIGRALDDRSGCAVLIETARALAETERKNDLYFVFTVQEEVGCRGAGAAAFAIRPDYALAVDVTPAGDVPGAKGLPVKLGAGAAIKVKDRSVICHTDFVARLRDVAKAEKIDFQMEVLTYGGTDTAPMQGAATGCIAGAVSVPVRYCHSTTEMIDLDDTAACVRLCAAVAGGELA